MATFVLVPGAWLGAWVWKKITPVLRKKGHDVYTLALTGMGERVHLANRDSGIEVAVLDVINLIEFEDLREVVLVGHSFAGKVVSMVKDRIPDRVNMVVFLDAVVPDKKEGPQKGRDDWMPEHIKLVEDDATRNGDGWRLPLTDGLLVDLVDIKGADWEWFGSKLTPWPLRLLWDPISVGKNYFESKKAYILCTEGGDNVQEIIDKGLDGEYRIIDSGHWPMVSKPNELADALMDLAGDSR